MYTTCDTATFHNPKCQQSKIVRVLIGTDTTATTSEYITPVYTNTSPPHSHTSSFSFMLIPTGGRNPEQNRTKSWHPVNIHLLTQQKTRSERTTPLMESYHLPSHSHSFQLNATKTPYGPTGSQPDRLRILDLNIYCHNHKYYHFLKCLYSHYRSTSAPEMLGIPLTFLIAPTNPPCFFTLCGVYFLYMYNINLMHLSCKT